MSAKPRQRSEISLSLASVLVMSVNVRRFCLKVSAKAPAAALRVRSSLSCIRLSVGSSGSIFPGDLEAQAGDRLVEQPVPGRIAGDRFLVEELLDAIFELIGLLQADDVDEGAVVTQFGIGQRRFERVVVDAVELKREEQQVQRNGGDLVLHVAEKLGAHGVGRVAGMDEARERHQPADQIVKRFEAFDRLGQPRSAIRLLRKLDEPAFVGRFKSDCLGSGAIEVAPDLGRIDRGYRSARFHSGSALRADAVRLAAPRRDGAFDLGRDRDERVSMRVTAPMMFEQPMQAAHGKPMAA